MKSTTRLPANTATVCPERPAFARHFPRSPVTARLVSWWCLILIAASALGTPLRVDLRSDQTEIKDQNQRDSCNFFAVVAAMEAAYKRAGYGDLDLSEEFFNYSQKMFAMPPYDSSRQPWIAENHLGPTDGGHCVENLRILTVNKLRVPVETAMPYVTNYDHIPMWSPWLTEDLAFNPGADWSRPYFVNYQDNTDTVNLNPSFLPLTNLAHSLFYGVKSFKTFDPRNTDDVEAVLAGNKEVVVLIGLWQDRWLANPPGITISDDDKLAGTNGFGHCFPIVGYDKTDPNNCYFIVKNSAHRTSIPGAGGYQYVSYEYIRRYADSQAGYITAIEPAPTLWPELQFLGRWNFDCGELQGVLDIHHLPGMAQMTSPGELRLGTFFDRVGNAFRVNGSVVGNAISFWLDLDTPNPLYTSTTGRHFSYQMFRTGAKTDMAGFHTNPGDTRTYAGCARKNQDYLAGVPAPGPMRVSSYFGIWNVNFDGIVGTMHLVRRDDSGLAGWAGLHGNILYIQNNVVYSKTVILQVDPVNPSVVKLRIPQPDDREYIFDGKMLSSSVGIMAGKGTDPLWANVGFYAARTGAVPTSSACLDIQCPDNIVVRTCSPSGVPVDYTVIASNHCNPDDICTVVTPPPHNTFQFGTRTVNVVAYGSGQTKLCSFTVTVVPEFCPPEDSYNIPLTVAGSEWHFPTVNDVVPPTSWPSLNFDDSAWPKGIAPFGYGGSGIATPVLAGHVTDYFRHSFFVTNAAGIGGLQLRLKRDDGAIAYLNGIEVFRSNMPTGMVHSATLASSTVTGADQTNFVTTTFSPAALRNGLNVLAVEVHQSTTNSATMNFDLELKATPQPDPPGLEAKATNGGLLIRWPTTASSYILEQADGLGAAFPWSAVQDAPQISDGKFQVLVPVTAPQRFFRLRTTLP